MGMLVSAIDVLVGCFFAAWLSLIVYFADGDINRPLKLEIHPQHLGPISRPSSSASASASASASSSTSGPLTVLEISEYLSGWISDLHAHLALSKKAKAEGIWEAFHNFTAHTLYPWDQKYLQRMPPRRHDGSIFLSLASYRDENCLATMSQAYQKAKYADKLFVGLIQQRCYKDCRTGIMEDGKSRPQPEPDPDCHKDFCASTIGKPHCQAGRIRALHIQEPDSLGPYMARYFASKLWSGEEWFMQIDSHMTFAQDWDHISIDGLQKAPSQKPVLSHYPPPHLQDLKQFETKPSSRICGPIFTSETIRLEGSLVYDHEKLSTPRFSPFTGAGYFVAHSSFLKEVPFDPFLPWIFMGEEIIMSSRLWTSGYDMFSPAQAVVGHIYFRRHQPKFWESVHRAFTPGVHNPLEELILDRIKCQLGFPEASRDMIPKSLLTAVHHYTMGKVRPLHDYMKMIGMNAATKEVTPMKWCEQGQPPPGFEQYASLYSSQQQQQ
ncbi:Glycosyltransferase (GlcNAc) [Seminavis robusta]|uniref:Glycosyltransferase (GlcNAc) n=1 Tax=Seminavis robusta TaxID=568900 RepID=A0A9N8H9C5_9STRA|nr:Glycosyltransferase (GlcNAc) [Seminavis robusta]|eukprot:Sro270_g104320.1 Glycosyltransferase (GlcNAc) (495) ;mRNA; f:62643-64587